MQKAMKVTVAATTASTSSNLPENSRPANTSRFLTHSCGRMATIAALTGPRRGFWGASEGDGSALTGGVCSRVVPSMKARRLEGIDEDAGIEDSARIELGLGGLQGRREGLGA